VPLKQWDVAREFRRRLKKAFESEGIEAPVA
jgi:small-conductance mechanosensitive channel